MRYFPETAAHRQLVNMANYAIKAPPAHGTVPQDALADAWLKAGEELVKQR